MQLKILKLICVFSTVKMQKCIVENIWKKNTHTHTQNEFGFCVRLEQELLSQNWFLCKVGDALTKNSNICDVEGHIRE